MPPHWYALDLGDPLLAGPELDRIIHLFHSQYRDPGAAGQALFIRHDSEGRLHCHVIVYFPPACIDLALELGARTCASPARHDLGLLAGDDDAWTACFAD